MDISKQYIEMCEKAEEVQQLRYYDNLPKESKLSIYCNKGIKFLTDGDCYFDSEFNYVHYAKVYEFLIFQNIKDIWIPSQDQLQEILINDIKINESKVFILDHILYLFCQFTNEQQAWYNSFEQLWLHFVMKKKFNRIWSWEKQNWIK